MRACTAPATCDYNRRRRGYLLNHSLASDIEFLEMAAPDRYSEVNERGGFFLWVIHPRNVFSPGIIMTQLPEVLRLFKECWGGLSDRHFSGMVAEKMVSYDSRALVDIFCHAVPHPPIPVGELMLLRQKKNLNCWQRLTDRRAFLEYNSDISWQRLW